MSGEDITENKNDVAAAGVTPNAVVDPETTIFVGNLAVGVTTDDLKEVFQAEYGDQLEVEIPEPSKLSKGKSLPRRYAFIKFPHKIDVEAIKSKHDKTVIKEKGIFIRKVLTVEERENQKKAKKQQHRNNKRGNRYPNGRFNYTVSAPPNKEKPPLEEMERSTDTLYVNNIPYNATKEQLAEFFGTKPELITLPMRRMKNTKTDKVFYSNKMNRGIAFITFENLQVDIKNKVDEFQSKTLQDRPIVVDVAAKLRQPRGSETANEDQEENGEQTESKKEKKKQEKSESKK